MRARWPEVEKAQALRQEHGLGDAYVDVFDVLRRMDIEVYRKPIANSALEGSLIIRDGLAVVFVNSAGSLTRQRLTAAHELGHFLLGQRHDGVEILENEAAITDDREEPAAYRFARHFLMDAHGVTKLVADVTDPEERVAAVAHAYVVSPMAVAIHLEDLGHISRTVKDRLKQGFDAGGLKPTAFLARFGFRMDDLNDSATELDAGHVARAMTAYERGQMTLSAFAESVMKPDDEARALLLDAGVDIRDEEPRFDDDLEDEGDDEDGG
jgi:Zn-dependent peptidase ImmA (M78 family)